MFNNEILLPTRDFLRQLIGHSSVTESILREILRKRGVFCVSNTKDVLGSIIIKTGLSPNEFAELKHFTRTKEEKPKLKTRTIQWDSEANLMDCLPETFDFNSILDSPFGTVRVSNLGEFVHLDNPNHISLDYELERDDPIKNFGKNTTKHKGRLELKKENRLLTMSLTYTSNETMKFGDRINHSLIKEFKYNSYIKSDSEILKIKFDDFSNEARIAFLKELSKYPSNMLEFKDTTDIYFLPDDLNTVDVPVDINWMKNKIYEVEMKGKELHSTFFIEDVDIRPFIKLFSLQCKYQINQNDIDGTVEISFEFSRSDKDDKELVLTISLLKLHSNNSAFSKTEIEKQILDNIEQKKLEFYQKYKKKLE